MVTQRPVVIARGELKTSIVRKGTGSERMALIIEDDRRGRLVLTPLTGNSYELPQEQSMCGQRVEARGYLLDRELRYLSLKPL
jgi:hypothetical protein